MSMSLSTSTAAQQWLDQFAPGDQAAAVDLLNALVLVSSDEFRDRLQERMLRYAANVQGPVGLYAERELQPTPLFAESLGIPRRASGSGPAPFTSDNPDVGSEGIIAQLISELCRGDGDRFLNHPGPDEIRGARMRAFVLVTDFVGSGDRASEYLGSAWQVSSVRSWWSLGLLSFAVIAYSATQAGAKRVRRHQSEPTLDLVRTCPTIATEFSRKEGGLIRSLCEKYAPASTPFASSLGWGNVGALLGFSHGLPDNTPNILWESGGSQRPWVPLFPGRATVGRREHFKSLMSTEKILHRLAALHQYRLSISPRLREASSQGKQILLVLAALARRGSKTEETIASKTGLNILNVRDLLAEARKNELVNAKLLLTDAGHRELAYYRRREVSRDVLVPNDASPYYPRSLRPPRKSS